MKFTVLKEFTWAGQELKVGDAVDIPDESPKIGSLVRAKFIRFGDTPPRALPDVKEVVAEIKAEQQPAVQLAKQVVTRNPKEIVREAKARATGKK